MPHAGRGYSTHGNGNGNGKRVYKDEKDKALQEKMEGKNTPFQRALKAAENKGLKEFGYQGKRYASEPKPQPTAVPKRGPSITGGVKSSPMMVKKRATPKKKTGMKVGSYLGNPRKGRNYKKGGPITKSRSRY